MLPKDYPQLCYYYFRVWSEKKKIVEQVYLMKS